ncbi:MAG TPA: aminopeptidase P N-terminal domain-containing protein [Pyrinomonadaceae bacterium]
MFRKTAATAALASLLLGVAIFPVGAREASATDKRSAPVIRVAPPAPVIDDTARLAELAARRARVAEKIGARGMIVLFSTEPRVYTNDVDYAYRQENNLYYLTNLKQKGATLVLMPGNPQLPEILFLPRRDPAAETWTGHMYSPEEARARSGIKEVWENTEFEPFMRSVRARKVYQPKAGSIFLSPNVTASVQPVTPPVPMAESVTVASASAAMPAQPVTGQSPVNIVTENRTVSQPASQPGTPLTTQPNVSTAGSAAPTGYETLFAAISAGKADLFLLKAKEEESREYKQEQRVAAQWASAATGFVVQDATPIFTEMRLRKSPLELKLLQHAIDISIEAHQRAQAVASRLNWEYELDAEVLYTFKRRNADHWGYPNIVGCGPNATTLHYIESQGRIDKNDLMLMDVGAEYEHYTADITRTFPVSGKFTPEQAEIYNIVYAAQEAAAQATRPGSSIPEVHAAALNVIKDGLLRLGLITDRNSDQYRLWFMHGTSHWLGMNVHDVGAKETKFEPGMIFTNEPGIYIRGDALDHLPKTPESEKFIAAVRPAFEKYKNIGVRIEDDMLVTADGHRWLSAALPRSIADIEAFMARAPREVRISRLDRNLFNQVAMKSLFAKTRDFTAKAHRH